MDKRLDHTSEEYQNRIVYRVLELAATLPLIGIVAANFNKRKTYFKINDAQAELKQRSNQVQDLHYAHDRFHTATQNLYAQYKDAYYKSRLVTRQRYING